MIFKFKIEAEVVISNQAMDSTSFETSKVLTKKERYIKIATIVISNAAFIIFFGFATAHYINESE
jgi:hypothetical protein